MTSRSTAVYLARAAEILLGAVFLTGALVKALDVNLFAVQVAAYGVLHSQALRDWAAIATLGVETALGAAFVLGLRLRGWTNAAMLALLAVFTGLIVYGWVFHDLADCGCFGKLEMSPQVSVAKNIVLAALTGFAWWGFRTARAASEAGAPSSRKPVLKAAICLALGAACAVYGQANLTPVVRGSQEEGPFGQFVFEAEGLTWDLGEGEYLVAMLSATCEHCMASVPTLNEQVLAPQTPDVIGLCDGTPEELQEFKQLTSPFFPIHLVEDVRLFYEFIEIAPPRFFLIRDGLELAHWDNEPPTIFEVTEALGEHAPGS